MKYLGTSWTTITLKYNQLTNSIGVFTTGVKED